MNKLTVILLIWVSFGVRITTILPVLDDLCWSITVSMVSILTFQAVKDKYPNLALLPAILSLPMIVSDSIILYLTTKSHPLLKLEAKEIADPIGNLITAFGLTAILIEIAIYSYGTTRNI